MQLQYVVRYRTCGLSCNTEFVQSERQHVQSQYVQSELQLQNFSQKFCAPTQGQAAASHGSPGWLHGVKLVMWFELVSFFSWILRQCIDHRRCFFFFLRGGVNS